MSRICQITGKKTISGNYRSHSMNATKRKFYPNLHFHKFWIEEKKKFIKLRISSNGLRIINKKGLKNVMKKLKKNKNLFKKNINKVI